MGKKNQNFVMFKGDALKQEFLHVGPFWTQQMEVISVKATDAITFKFHEFENESNVHFTKTRAAGEITVETSGFYEDDDTIVVAMDTADTSGLPADEYGYQLEVSYGGLVPVVVASGIVDLVERAD